ncbi:hypothetical protein IJT93_01980 [bacterium]|nr:hypothetical protein [bacterium]
MKKNILFSIGLGLAVAGAGFCFCGCSDSDETGSLTFTVQNSGTPDDPDIHIPGATANLKMELFQEPAVTGKPVTFKDEPSTGKISARGFGEKDDKTTHTYYFSTVSYSGDGDAELSLSDVDAGEWIMRISALDSSGNTLGYHQESVNINAGNSREKKGWLRSGSAPEGYIYAAHTAEGFMSRISLYSNIVEKCTLNVGHPAYLFAKNSALPSFSDKIYASSGDSNVLELTPYIADNKMDVEELSFVQNQNFARGGVCAVFSFSSEGLVRFFNYEADTGSSYDYCYTGAGAGYISNPVDNEVWVCNTNSRDLTRVSLTDRTTINSQNTPLGSDLPIAAESESDREKVWVIGTRSEGGFVRALLSDDVSGKNWGEFTTDLKSPGAVCVNEEKEVCVTDNSRGELIFLDGSKLDENGNIKEIFGSSGARMKLSGGGDQIISDGSRLYILQYEHGRIVAYDLATKAVLESYSLGTSARSMIRVK